MPPPSPALGPAGPPAIAVFGSNDPRPGSPAYEQAREVGRRLAAAGLTVLNGGYAGVMEASARGAREAGGRTIGVTCRAFSRRPGANRFIETEWSTADLHERTRRLIESAAGFVVLPGRSGTLAELTLLWALRKADLLGDKPIVLLGEVFEGLLRDLRRHGFLDEEVLDVTRSAASPAEAVEALRLRLAGLPPGAVPTGRANGS